MAWYDLAVSCRDHAIERKSSRLSILRSAHNSQIRAPANAIATTANWIFNFMVVMVTPVAFNSIGYKTYVGEYGCLLEWTVADKVEVFAVINAFMVPCVYFFCRSSSPVMERKRAKRYIRPRNCLPIFGRNGRDLSSSPWLEGRIHCRQSCQHQAT